MTLLPFLAVLPWAALLGLAGCSPCICESAKLSNQWCDACNVGYVSSARIESLRLFEALDAHGHDLDPAVMTCASCKALMKSGGFCEECRFGWVGGQAYMSRLTYHMAKGKPRETGSLACSTCAGLAGKVGWCDSCKGGWAGNVYFENREDYSAAAFEFGRLEAMIETSQRCDECAMAMLVDGKCPYCKISFAGGKALPASH